MTNHHCLNCGIWSKCQKGFKRFLDQKDCCYSIKSDNRDQCMFATEAGQCSNLDAQKAARDDSNST